MYNARGIPHGRPTVVQLGACFLPTFCTIQEKSDSTDIEGRSVVSKAKKSHPRSEIFNIVRRGGVLPRPFYALFPLVVDTRAGNPIRNRLNNALSNII